MIKIKRDSGWADRLRRYKILLDGTEVGTIKNGQELLLNAQAGEHELFLKIDWMRSNKVVFESGESVVEFECSSSLRGLKLFLALVYSLFLPHKWLRLEQKL